MTIEIPRTLYTELADSPRQRSGFHTVCYSTGRLSPDEVDRIEAHIHWPESLGLEEKWVFFPLEREQGEPLHGLLHFRALPEARDRFGRGGVFLCQGFFLPRKLWQDASLEHLIALLSEHLFPNREALRQSPMIRLDHGDIAPVKWDGGHLARITEARQPPPPSPETIALAALLFDAVRDDGGNHKIRLHAPPGDVLRAVGDALAWLPPSSRGRISLDPAYDGASIALGPFLAAGYTRQRPHGRAVDLESGTGGLPPLQTLAARAYGNWLDFCTRTSQTVPADDLEHGARLADFIGGAEQSPTGRVSPEFSEANAGLIGTRFREEASRRFDETLATRLHDYLPPSTQLLLLIRDFPMTDLAEPLERAIVEERIYPRPDRSRLPAAILAGETAGLRFLARLWHEGAVESLEELPPGHDRHRWLRYLAGGPWRHEPWMQKLIRDNREAFEAADIPVADPSTAASPVSRLSASLQRWWRNFTGRSDN